MNIDLMTFFAQIINLFVLAFLLKKFLYKPILRIVEERQNEIIKQLSEAKKAQRLSEVEYKDYLAKTQAFEKEKKLLWQECYQKLEKEKQKQKNFLSKQRHQALEELQKELDLERDKLGTELSLIIARNFLELSKKILKDLSIASPVDLILQGLKKQILLLSQKEILILKDEIKKEKSVKIVSYSFLSEDQVKEIELCLRKSLGIRIFFDTEVVVNSELLMGVEIYIGSKMIDWNLKTYLDAFEESIHARLSNLIVQKEEG